MLFEPDSVSIHDNLTEKYELRHENLLRLRNIFPVSSELLLESSLWHHDIPIAQTICSRQGF